jgi:hypothetical protein
VLYRRQLLKALAAGSIALGTSTFAESGPPHELSSRRPPPGQRKFTSRSVEEIIQRVKAGILDEPDTHLNPAWGGHHPYVREIRVAISRD